MTTDTAATERRELEPQTRTCEMCQEERRVSGKVGPVLIKEPCPNKCAAGYAL